MSDAYSTNPLSFAFWGNRPSGPGSYPELEARRKIAQAMLGKRSPFPQNVGQGLTYLGERLGDVAMWRGLQGQEAAQSGLLQGDAKKAAEPDETPTVPPEPAAPYPRLPQPGRFDPNLPAVPPGFRAQPTTPPRSTALNGTQAPNDPDPLNQITLAAMRQPSFMTASGERPAPMPAAPAVDRTQLPPAGPTGNAPNVFGPATVNPATGARRDVPTQPSPNRFSPEFGKLANVPTMQTMPTAPADIERIGAALTSPQPMTGSAPMVAYVPPGDDTPMMPRTIARAPGGGGEGGGGGGGGPGGGNPPIATDIPPAPDAAAPKGPGFSPQPGALPGAPPAKQQEFPESRVLPFVQPKPPPQTPPTERERNATRMWYATSDNPPRQAIWAGVIADEQARRKFIDERNVKVFDTELEKYKTDVAKYQEGERGRQAAQIEAAKKIQELRQNEPTAGVAPMPPGHPLLNTPQSDQRTGVPNVIPMPGIPLAKAAEQQGPAMAKALDATKTAIPEFANALKTIQLTLNHPDLGSATGLGGAVMRHIPGTAAYDPGALLGQIENENFLAAYNILRGGGQISNVEGEKAQRAKANIDPKQSEPALRASLLRLENQMRLDMETAQRKMNMPVTAWRTQGDNSSVAPDKGYREGNMEYIGGNPGDQSSWRRFR